MPFVFADAREAQSVRAYLAEFLQTYGGEEATFTPSNLSYVDNVNQHGIQMDVRLAPYDQGITQETQVLFTKADDGRWHTQLLIHRTHGSVDSWTRLNRDHIDQFRKQFLLWGSLSSSDKAKYESGSD